MSGGIVGRRAAIKALVVVGGDIISDHNDHGWSVGGPRVRRPDS